MAIVKKKAVNCNVMCPACYVVRNSREVLESSLCYVQFMKVAVTDPQISRLITAQMMLAIEMRLVGVEVADVGALG